MSKEISFEEGPYTLISTCSDCGRHLKAEYYNDNAFETHETKFLRRLGTETVHYCPYCGKRSGGFSPYDLDEPINFNELDEPSSSRCSASDEYDDNDEHEDSWWPDSEAIELDDDCDDDPDDNPWKMDAESITKIYTCENCKESFRLNPKGYKELFCLYCGKEL